jgi:hypothetical protein
MFLLFSKADSPGKKNLKVVLSLSQILLIFRISNKDLKNDFEINFLSPVLLIIFRFNLLLISGLVLDF